MYALLMRYATLFSELMEVLVIITRSKKDQQKIDATRRTRWIYAQLSEDTHCADGLVLRSCHAGRKLASTSLHPWERVQIGCTSNP